jgi:hypothetical protein
MPEVSLEDTHVEMRDCLSQLAKLEVKEILQFWFPEDMQVR